VQEAILPELFILLSIDLFLLLSLLTCLLEERFPKALPYIYQIAALIGFGQLLVSREFFTIFGEYMRFWYNFFYFIVALANIIGVNVYLAVSRKQWTLARAWFGAVAFPAIAISTLLVADYGNTHGAQFPLLLLQVWFVASAFVTGLTVSVLLRPDLLKKLKRRMKKENEKDTVQEINGVLDVVVDLDAHSDS
jgi:hypothetical protein